MKLKLMSIFVFIFILISCKNENKETTPVAKPVKSGTNTSLSDSIKSDSVDVVSSSDDLAENRKLLLDFYIKNNKKPQFFLINNTKDTTIVCAEKTRIKIEANSFTFVKTGKNAGGKIKISVKEYYNISDIILGRLSTTSNGKLLETGGMLDISATSIEEKCELKKEIQIEFPRKKEKEGMQLFTGKWKNNEINWNLVANSVDLNQTFTKVDEMPVYPGGFPAMYKFVGRSIVLPDETINGKVFARFVVNKEGNVTDIKITKGLGKAVDAAVIKGLEKLAKFTPGKVNGVAVNTTYSLPVTIKQDGIEDGQNVSTPQKYLKPIYDDKTLKNADFESIGYYLLRSSKLGTINCDRFLNYDESPKIDFVINLKNDAETSLNIVFHRFKSVMRRSSYDQNIFKAIPSGEKITIVAFKYLDRKPFLAIKETETSARTENDLVFQEVTFEKLKNEMQNLNQLK